MTFQEKMSKLQLNHYSEWVDMRKKVDEEVSTNQSMFCVCRRLATGLHEMGCQKFKDKVNRETVKRLKHLL